MSDTMIDAAFAPAAASVAQGLIPAPRWAWCAPMAVALCVWRASPPANPSPRR
jgi:hypothetical protein